MNRVAPVSIYSPVLTIVKNTYIFPYSGVKWSENLNLCAVNWVFRSPIDANCWRKRLQDLNSVFQELYRSEKRSFFMRSDFFFLSNCVRFLLVSGTGVHYHYLFHNDWNSRLVNIQACGDGKAEFSPRFSAAEKSIFWNIYFFINFWHDPCVQTCNCPRALLMFWEKSTFHAVKKSGAPWGIRHYRAG